MTTDPKQQPAAPHDGTGAARLRSVLGGQIADMPSVNETVDALWEATQSERTDRKVRPAPSRPGSPVTPSSGRPLPRLLRIPATDRTPERLFEVWEDGTVRPAPKRPPQQRFELHILAFGLAEQLMQALMTGQPVPPREPEPATLPLTPRGQSHFARPYFLPPPTTTAAHPARQALLPGKTDAVGMTALSPVRYMPPPAVAALSARQAVLLGDTDAVDMFTCRYLRELTHPQRAARWREAVKAALLEPEWSQPLEIGHSIGPTIRDIIIKLARTMHLQQTPLFNRKVRGRRLLSLDAPLGNSLTFYDLAPAATSADEQTLAFELSDPDLTSLLRSLNPDEREIVFAHGYDNKMTWTEAALLAGIPESDAPATGERVRRKVRRLCAEQQRRKELQRLTGIPRTRTGRPGGQS
ncbi:hypothetical protein [Streptomyces xanthophaeus]